MIRNLPDGWTTRKTRFLWAAVNPQGEEVLFSLTEEDARRAVYCLPEFGGTAYTHTISAHIDL